MTSTKRTSVKKLMVTLLIAVFILSFAGFAFGEKIVGIVKDITEKDGVKVFTIDDEKSGESKTVECGEKCKISAGAEQKGQKVTISIKPKGTKIRKAVVGC